MLNINEFVSNVHDNAVAHGWWEEDRSPTEVLALIHSELSEALEEYRAGRGMLWYKMNDTCQSCEHCYGSGNTQIMCVTDKCDRNNKPEGIDIELIDACIRIFDYFGRKACILKDLNTIDDLINLIPEKEKALIANDTVPQFVAYLHAFVSSAYYKLDDEDSFVHIDNLIGTVAAICFWVREKGFVPDELLIKKHEFNLTRSYKHGNKVC